MPVTRHSDRAASCRATVIVSKKPIRTGRSTYGLPLKGKKTVPQLCLVPEYVQLILPRGCRLASFVLDVD